MGRRKWHLRTPTVRFYKNPSCMLREKDLWRKMMIVVMLLKHAREMRLLFSFLKCLLGFFVLFYLSGGFLEGS